MSSPLFSNLITRSPCNSRIFGEMKIRKLQNREFQGPHVWVYMPPKIVLIPLYNANWKLFFNFYEKSSNFLAFSSLKKLGFIAKCRQFEGFKKTRIANPRNSKPRNARIPVHPPSSCHHVFALKTTLIFIFVITPPPH